MVDYVLYTYGFLACAFVYAAAWTLGGPRARLVLSLGAYAYHPAYQPPSARWRRERIETRRGHVRPADHFPSWHQHFADSADSERPTPGIDNAPTVTVPTLVRAEMAADGSDTGAEHWGGLLREMSTEERAIYNAEMVETYEATKAVERPFQAALDDAIASFQSAVAEQEQREAAAFDGTWHNLMQRNGGHDRWATGQYALVPANA